MKTLRIAVIGIGNIGSAHSKYLYGGNIENAVLSAVCDIAPEKRKLCGELFPDVPFFANIDELTASKVCDAVIVSVPHPYHAEIAIKAMEAGLHVLCEKPLSVAVSSARKMLDAAKKNGVVFAVMLNQRTLPIFRRARELVQSGALGQIKRSVWIITNWYRTQSYYNSSSWRATWKGEGGGVLLNQAPHNLDLWQWICGMPTKITAFCDVAKYHKIEVEDDVTIQVRYENGGVGTFITSTGEYPGTNRLEISGDLGKLVLENGVLKYWKLSQSVSDNIENSAECFTEIPCEYSEETFTEPKYPHGLIIENFKNRILYGEELISPAEDGLCELSISNGAFLSSWTDSTVSLPLDCEKFDAYFEKLCESGADTHAASGDFAEGEYSQRWKTRW